MHSVYSTTHSGYIKPVTVPNFFSVTTAYTRTVVIMSGLVLNKIK